MKNRNASIRLRPGVRVRTLHGEEDLDHRGEERHTEPGTWGYITGKNHDEADGTANWDVCFPNGCWVVITSLELGDPKQYELADPESSLGALLSLNYLLNEGGLTMLDDGAVGDAERVTSGAKGLLRLMDEAARLVGRLKAMPGVHPSHFEELEGTLIAEGVPIPDMSDDD